VAPAFAQQPPPPPTFATTRSKAALKPAEGGTRYMDMGSDKGVGFILEQRGSSVLLQVEGSNEILSLQAIPGPRGDTFLVDDRGRTVLRVTSGGNVLSYLGNPTGAPADPAGMVAPLSKPPMTASLDAMRARAASELTRLAGHEVTIWGTQAFASHETWAADALNNVVIGVKDANGVAGKAASRLDKVTLVPAKTPRVSFKDGELKLEVNPADEWGGRVSSDAISNVLTAARSAG
jgi:hypothetical protein